jgi:Secretion system C-terminal sorting domain/Metallo-peptidase family M12
MFGYEVPTLFRHNSLFQDGASYWEGVSFDGLSTFNFTQTDEGVDFFLVLGAQNIAFQSIALDVDHVSVVIELDYAQYAALDCATIDDESTPQVQVSASVAERTDCPIPIRILFAYSKAAKAIANPNSAAAGSIVQLNSWVIATGLDPKAIAFESAGVVFFNILETKLKYISYEADLAPNYKDLRALRDQYKADIVCLLVEANYLDAVGASKDIGASNENAYCVVRIGYATSLQTVAHEVSHLIGARHQNTDMKNCQTNADPSTSFHGFKLTPLKGQIVPEGGLTTGVHVLADCNNMRVGMWSNPNKKLFGFPAGSTTENNAAIILSRSSVVAGFRGQLIGGSISYVNIGGGDHICAGSCFAFFTADVADCQLITPLTYTWSVSSNGIAGWTDIGNNSYLPLNQCYFGNNDIYLRLKVVDLNGKVGYAIKQIDVKQCAVKPNDREVLVQQIRIYPNPSIHTSHVTLSGLDASVYKIQVKNAHGKELSTLKVVPFDIKDTHFTFDCSTLSSGIYFVYVFSGNQEITTLKLIKI